MQGQELKARSSWQTGADFISTNNCDFISPNEEAIPDWRTPDPMQSRKSVGHQSQPLASRIACVLQCDRQLPCGKETAPFQLNARC